MLLICRDKRKSQENELTFSTFFLSLRKIPWGNINSMAPQISFYFSLTLIIRIIIYNPQGQDIKKKNVCVGVWVWGWSLASKDAAKIAVTGT